MEKLDQTQKRDEIVNLPLNLLVPFRNPITIDQVDDAAEVPKGNPFRIVYSEDQADLKVLTDSIRLHGVCNPLIVRPQEDGKYQIISGHRRAEASKYVLDEVPAIIRDLSDDEAIIELVNSNLHREHILPSERAWAYRLRLEAEKHQGHRSDLTLDQIGPKLTLAQRLASDFGDSPTQVKRYIRLTYLHKDLLRKVDTGTLGFTAAVELSFMNLDDQRKVLETLDGEQISPSLSQAQRLRAASSKAKPIAEGKVRDILMSPTSPKAKAESEANLVIPMALIRRFFPGNYTPEQMVDQIVHLLRQQQRKRQQSR